MTLQFNEKAVFYAGNGRRKCEIFKAIMLKVKNLQQGIKKNKKLMLFL